MSTSIIDINSEELYQIIKGKIKEKFEANQKLKKTSPHEYVYTQEEIFCSKKFLSFDNNNLNEWLSAPFGVDFNRKKILSPKIKDIWTNCEQSHKRSGIEIQDKVFCSKENINYKIVNNNLKTSFILKGESDFWIFLHTKGKLEDETAVILVTKYKELSSIVFMSLGIIIKNDDLNEDEDKKYFFRIFQTLQLVETYDKNYIKNTKYESADSCLVKINVIDEGNETIKISAWINEGNAENKLVGNFCTPVILNNTGSSNNTNNINDRFSSTFDIISDSYKIMFAGSGQSCELLRFSCEIDFKENNDYFTGCKQGFDGCNCCIII